MFSLKKSLMFDQILPANSKEYNNDKEQSQVLGAFIYFLRHIF